MNEDPARTAALIAHAVTAATSRAWLWHPDVPAGMADGYTLADTAAVTALGLDAAELAHAQRWILLLLDHGKPVPVPDDQRAALAEFLGNLGWQLDSTDAQQCVVIDTSGREPKPVGLLELVEAVAEIAREPWSWVPGSRGFTLTSASLPDSDAAWVVGHNSEREQFGPVPPLMHQKLLRGLNERGWHARVSGFHAPGSERFGYLVVGPRAADDVVRLPVGEDLLDDDHLPNADVVRPLALAEAADTTMEHYYTATLSLNVGQVEDAMTAWKQYEQTRRDASAEIARVLERVARARSRYEDQTEWLRDAHRDAVRAQDEAEDERLEREREQHEQKLADELAAADAERGPRDYARVELPVSQRRTGSRGYHGSMDQWKLHRATCPVFARHSGGVYADAGLAPYKPSMLRASDALTVLLGHCEDCLTCEPGWALAVDEHLDEQQREQARAEQTRRENVITLVKTRTLSAMVQGIGLHWGWSATSGAYCLVSDVSGVVPGEYAIGFRHPGFSYAISVPEGDRDQLAEHMREQGMSVRWLNGGSEHDPIVLLVVHRLTRAQQKAARSAKKAGQADAA